MRRDHKAGFTLIEMCMLIAVLGTVLTIAVVGTSRMIRSSRLSGAANVMVADVRYARMLATSQGRNFEIRFRPAGYSVVRVTPLATILSRTCPSGVTCSASDTATFYAWGLTAPVTITLAATEGSKVIQLGANGSITR
jgi:Tfp pilus assembly protein FimT